jgi:membrane-bound serine protease (ClpP class)
MPLAQAQTQATVARCTLQGTVDAGSAGYLVSCVERALARKDEALLVRLDTPGGSLDATREIVRALLPSKVPVLVWVGPSGAHAGSAGVFLVLASHLAAMAPGTNVGAAHPVLGPGGADPEQAGGKEMARKIVNDTAAFAESIAHQRGRNAEWAAKAVKESASVSAERAVELKVIDLVAASEEAFLAAADGRTVTLEGEKRVLRTKGASVVELAPSVRDSVVHWLSNPSLAYLLFLIGSLGLGIELTHPGMIVPGLIGGICFVLALVAFSALPVQAGGVALLLIGIGMIVGELFVTSGLLGAGGLVVSALGATLLVDKFDPGWFVEPSFALPWRLVVPTTAFFGGALLYVVFKANQARALPQRGGDVGLLGEKGTAQTEVTPKGGEVFVMGERWRAVSAAPVAAGARVVVRGVEGLTLKIEEVKDE